MRRPAVGSALCTFIAYAAAFVRAESPPQAMETVHRTRQWFTGTWIGRVVLALAAYRIYRRFYAPRKSIAGKTVLVTGAGGGIGRELCLELARRGANIVLWDLVEDAARRVADEVLQQTPTAKVWTYAVDVSKAEVVAEKAQQVLREVGFVAILINNAGIVNGKPLLEVSNDRIIRTFEVNTLANFWTTRAFLPEMLKRREGHIVTVASAAGLLGVPGLVDYCSSKFGAVGFHEALRAELHRLNATFVKTTVICPSHVDTQLFKGFKPATFTQTLTPQYTAQRIVHGLQTDEPLVVLPELVYASLWSKAILPVPLHELIVRLVGISSAMDSFAGQSK